MGSLFKSLFQKADQDRRGRNQAPRIPQVGPYVVKGGELLECRSVE